ncbi:CDP-glycerol glycerophosphotransferase, TagB/SpsB family [Brevibacterium linens ATCC 9172]|uniref:CDP-glycerol glycerophosphotransferase, TagB/SpsB family n=1 Tax=Brevibacterium linens ATCC 9172 TaxID=1255617 RepID=A0A2H1KRM8_BRELN|nr:CDP-glycerol glycerophosphotransferase, TagB/SpsB family [Brevibacterium linens ATCC 9172]
MHLGPQSKQLLLKTLPSATSAYLRRERVQWAKQLRQNKRSLLSAVRSRKFVKTLSAPVRKKTIVWESFSGNGALCNPEALFRQMVDDAKYREFRHTWVLSTKAWDSPFRAEFAKHPRVDFVKYRSTSYFERLESSQYLFNNATFPAEFIKRPDQTYVNMWHGTPLKKMGYDIENGADGARNVLRNFMSADYLVSQNSFMTNEMYLGAYKLANIFDGAIIEEGYPRTDSMFASNAGDPARKALRRRGIETDGKKVLLYAPTWRGESFYKPNADANRLKATLRTLRERPELQDWVVLLKAHQVIFDQLTDDPEFAEFLIPNDVPANEALAMSDMLLTDYSSIFIDYLATGRPIAFHIPDSDSYSSDRGMYLDPSDLPGPTSRTDQQLVENVVDMVDVDRFKSAFPRESERYSKLASELTVKDDGRAGSRVLDVVFGGNEANYKVRRGFHDGRKKLVVYLGGMITNGITSSALNLLNSIDSDEYDVTAFFYRSGQRDRKENAAMIPGHVRQVIRDASILQLPMLGSMNDLENTSFEDLSESDAAETIWDWEWRRIFGHAQFDVAVDFSGYSSYWTRIVAHATAPRKVIWLHNDLVADAEREVSGVRPHFRNLTGVFKLYRDFDALVSVSPDLDRINQKSLTRYAPARKFTSARNTINVERIRTGTGGSMASNFAAGDYSLQNLGHAVKALGQFYSYDEIITEASRQRSLSSFVGDGGGATFVTVGRLSPEKNHARLIRAFAKIAPEEPDAKLVIIGEGPLENELKQLAVSLGIAGMVQFTGRLRNPYSVMSACDCFVMSSDYEGQPIVILEARVLGLPIVTTRFGSVESAMEASGGLIVDRDEEELAEGLRTFLRGDISARAFDGDDYNRSVMEEFIQVVFGNTNEVMTEKSPVAEPITSTS